MREKLLSTLRRDFEGFEAIKASEAGIPVYFIKLTVEALEPQPLPSFALYFLHAVALGVSSSADIAYLLGVEERDLLGTGAQLLKANFIEQGFPDSEGKRLITLTDQGRQALGQNTAPPVPRQRTCSLHFNALTWMPIPLEEESWSVEQMCKEGLFVLPSGEHTAPTLGDFTEKEVKYCLSYDRRFQKSDIVALLELKKVEPEYIAPVHVFLLRHRETKEQRLAVYRNGRQLPAEAAVLQRLFDEQSLHFPDDAVIFTTRRLDLPAALPPRVIQTAQTLAQSEERLQQLKDRLAEEKERRGTTQDEAERRASGERIQQLKEELQIKRQEMQEIQRQLADDQTEFLQTEQHRAILERALREAKQEIIIISPWMNRRACNDALCRLVGDAVARGVRIRIGYGIRNEQNPRDAERNRNNVRQVKNAFERAITKGPKSLLEMRETSGTHQKILVCDRKFAVAGSFNWLSYVGERDEGYRNETSVLLHQREAVDKLATIALQAFSS